MSSIEAIANQEYKYGFVTEIESETIPRGLNEEIIRTISAKKSEPEWMLEWRLKAYRHWLTMTEPEWAAVHYPKIDYQDIIYYSAPKPKEKKQSLDEVDPQLPDTFEKLGIPLHEQKMLANVAVDAIFDSVSVATTFKEKLAKEGVIFCSFSEAVHEYPELIQKYIGSVVPYTDNFYAALNSAVFSDGSFCYIPKGVRSPMELSSYFRINNAESGQFERTLIVAEEGSYVSYLEGCTAPKFDKNQLHAAVVELVALDHAEIKYSTVQNWYAGDEEGRGGIYNFVTKRGKCAGAPLQDLLDTGRDGLGDHLEVPELYSAGGSLDRRILFCRPDEPPAAGRHRDEDDPCREEYPQPDHLEGDLGGKIDQQLPRARQSSPESGERPQLFAVRFAADRQPLRRKHLSVHRGRE